MVVCFKQIVFSFDNKKHRKEIIQIAQNMLKLVNMNSIT